MFILFIVFVAISGIILVTGLAWWLASSGRTTRRSGRDVGAEIMGSSANDEDVSVTLLEKSAYAGTGVAVESEAEVSYADLKQMVRERRWRAALPPLLAMGGLLGLIVFGALALWVRLDDKFLATVIAAVALFAVARVVRDFVRR